MKYDRESEKKRQREAKRVREIHKETERVRDRVVKRLRDKKNNGREKGSYEYKPHISQTEIWDIKDLHEGKHSNNYLLDTAGGFCLLRGEIDWEWERQWETYREREKETNTHLLASEREGTAEGPRLVRGLVLLLLILAILRLGIRRAQDPDSDWQYPEPGSYPR